MDGLHIYELTALWTMNVVSLSFPTRLGRNWLYIVYSTNEEFWLIVETSSYWIKISEMFLYI